MLIQDFSSSSYFFNLIALSVLLLPLYMIASNALVRRLLLIIAGLYLLYMIAPRLMVFYVLFWTLISIVQAAIASSYSRRWGQLVFIIGLLLTLAPMIIWKLWYNETTVVFNLLGNQSLAYFSEYLWTIDLARNIIIPIGLSFASFRAADLLIKTYIGSISFVSYSRVLFYGLFPAVQVVGPIIEYEEVQDHQGQYRQPDADDILQGFLRIALGLLKVLVVARVLQDSVKVFQEFPDMGAGLIWFNLIAYSWFFYLNFSAYSDLAIGISRLYGFRLKENFNFPFFQVNIAEFWNNWHMSLSRFAQRNAFIPLGGYRARTQYRAVFFTMLLIALWHNISWGMLLFGLYHATGLILHRLIKQRQDTKKSTDNVLRTGVNIVFTYFFVLISFPLLVVDLQDAFSLYAALFLLN